MKMTRATPGRGVSQRRRWRCLCGALLSALLLCAGCGADDPDTCAEEPPVCGSACVGDAVCQPMDACALFRANKPVEWRCVDGKWSCVADPILPCS